MKIHHLKPNLNTTTFELFKQNLSATSLVSLENIEVSFNGQKALQNINLSIYPNSITTIVRPMVEENLPCLKFC